MDVVVTVPKARWREWLTEGDWPGEPWSGQESYFYVPRWPQIAPGERVYIVAFGRLRGWAPLVRIHNSGGGTCALVRRDGAEAVTLPGEILIPGFRGYRYRWWDRRWELPFPDWRETGT